MGDRFGAGLQQATKESSLMAYKKKRAKSATDTRNKDYDFVRKALEKYERAYNKEQSNITQAYEDLEFRIGEQWPTEVKRQREVDSRPCLTVNKIPSFVHQ